MSPQLVELLGIAVAVAVLAQLTKADGWNRWAKVLYSIVVAGGAGSVTGNITPEALTTIVTAALAFHGLLLNGTSVGDATKWNLLGKFGDVVRAVFPSEEKK